MKNSVVIFNGKRQHTFTGKKECIVCLNPGSNVVSIESIEKLIELSDSFVDGVDSKEIEILEDGVVKAETKDKGAGAKDPADDSIILNITEMGAREAVLVIKAEIQVDTIKGYLSSEQASDSRPSVVKACEEAIKSLSQSDDSGS